MPVKLYVLFVPKTTIWNAFQLIQITWMKLKKLGKLGIVVIASPQSCLLIALMMIMNFYYRSMIWFPPLKYNVSLIYFFHLLSWMIMITNLILLMQTPIWTILTHSVNILQIAIIFLNRHLSTKWQNHIKWGKISPFVTWILEVWEKI